MKKLIDNKYVRFYFVYTFVFLITIVLSLQPFITNHISFVWDVDGWTQHYKALYFYSNWLKDIARGILVDHRLHIDLYSFSLGYGSDIITTLHYYVVGDPLFLFSVLIPDDKLVYFYTALMYFRFYLSGIAFSIYCFYIKKTNHTAVLAGSLLYALSLYLTKGLLHHPYFTNPYIYLPLLLVGAEMILGKKSKLPFILAVFLSAVSNFYFFYMLVVLTVIYVFIRLAGSWKENGLSGTARMLGIFSGTGIIGVMMSSFILLPVLYLFRSGSRLETSIGQGVEVLYPRGYYKELFASLFTGSWAHQDIRSIYLGLSCIGFICMILLFVRKGHLQLKAGAFVVLLIMLSPLGGKMMNGFSYASGRWVFGFTFLAACIVTVMWDEMFRCRRKEAAITLGIFYLSFALMAWINHDLGERSALTMLFYVFVLSLITTLFLILPQFKKGKMLYTLSSAGCLVIVCLSIILRIRIVIDPAAGNAIRRFSSYEQVNSRMICGLDRALLTVDDHEKFFRYGSPYTEAQRNSTAVSGLKGIHYYWSLADSELNEYFDEMGLPVKNDFNFRNLNDVTSLTDLASVKYYAIKSRRGRKRIVPFGFEKIKQIEEPDRYGRSVFSVFKNKYFLPFGYTYDSVIDDGQYESMNFLEKQNAPLQGIHVSDQDLNDRYPKTNIDWDYKRLNYRLSGSEGVEIENNRYKVKGKKGKLNFEILNAKPECITSMMLQGIYFEPVPEEREKYHCDFADIKVFFQEGDEDKLQTSVKFGTENYFRYSNRHDFQVNMGYSTEAKKTFSIILPAKGTYRIDSITVYNQPVDRYPDQLNKLRENVLEDITFDNNVFSGNVDLKKDKILCLSIPYSAGWKAWVNDKPAKISRANTMFMAIPLKKGNNAIRLKYTTPLLPAGIAISVLGVLIAIGVFIMEKKKNKTNQDKTSIISSSGREIISYLIVGVLTTFVSLGVYYLCSFTFLDARNPVQLQLANIISWVCAVAFAYVTNRIFVFESKSSKIGREITSFVASRVGTLLMDMGIMFVTVTLMGMDDKIAKLLVQVVVTVGNYVLSKWFVFNKN